MRTLFLALWFGASIGWTVAATMVLSPGDIFGSPTAHSRSDLNGLLTDLDCTGFGRQAESDACRSIARQARERELLLRRDEAVDIGIYLLVVAVPIFAFLAIGYSLVGRIERARRRSRQDVLGRTGRLDRSPPPLRPRRR